MKTKTWKREVATILQGLFWYVVFKGDVAMAEVLVYPVFTLTAFAFGLDWFSKSGGLLKGSVLVADGGRPERSGEYPSREDK